VGFAASQNRLFIHRNQKKFTGNYLKPQTELTGLLANLLFVAEIMMLTLATPSEESCLRGDQRIKTNSRFQMRMTPTLPAREGCEVGRQRGAAVRQEQVESQVEIRP